MIRSSFQRDPQLQAWLSTIGSCCTCSRVSSDHQSKMGQSFTSTWLSLASEIRPWDGGSNPIQVCNLGCLVQAQARGQGAIQQQQQQLRQALGSADGIIAFMNRRVTLASAPSASLGRPALRDATVHGQASRQVAKSQLHFCSHTPALLVLRMLAGLTY